MAASAAGRDQKKSAIAAGTNSWRAAVLGSASVA
jgi:hypothetical protein